MEARRDIFQAIADPTRRRIISLISKKQLNLHSVAQKFDMSRQAVSLHIQILEECGLVFLRKQGRERICEARLEKLGEVSAWVEQYKQHWEQKLDSLEKYLHKLQKKRKHGSHK
jgi:DNA-binding transcriptional ArsR family regulator